MQYIVSFLFGLILMIEVDVVFSDTGFCYFCQDYLNAIQCNANIYPSCTFINGTCTTNPVPTVQVSNLTCAQKNESTCYGYEVNSTTMQCYQHNDTTCIAFDNTQPCTTFSNSSICSVNPNCIWNSSATKMNEDNGNCYSNTCNNSINCTGFDGNYPNLVCVTNKLTQACYSFDPSQGSCPSYIQSQCDAVQNCYWTEDASQGNFLHGYCSNASCSNYNSRSECTAIVTSYNALTARACKWRVNNTLMNNGSCGNGRPVDLSKTLCSNFSMYFTYSDKLQRCTACTETNIIIPNSFSSIVYKLAISIIVVTIGW